MAGPPPPRGLRARLRRLLVLDEDPALVAAAPPVPVRSIVRRFWPYARRTARPSRSCWGWWRSGP